MKKAGMVCKTEYDHVLILSHIFSLENKAAAQLDFLINDSYSFVQVKRNDCKNGEQYKFSFNS